MNSPAENCVLKSATAENLKYIKQGRMHPTESCNPSDTMLLCLVRSMMGSLSLQSNLQSISFLDDTQGDPERRDRSEDIGGL